MNDQTCLVDALKAMGHKPVVSDKPQQVRGHYNETRTAQIILKKEDLKDGGDIGFEKDAKTGNFSIVADTYVLRNIDYPKLTKEVKLKYAETKIKKQASVAGLTFLNKVVNANGSYKMVFVKA